MIVVDTNVLVYLFIQGPKTGPAKRLLEREPRWMVPPLWRHEFHNVLVGHALTGRLNPAQVRSLWGSAVDFLAGSQREPDMELALELAIAHKITGYGAQFLALARAHRTVCVTEDSKLRAKAPAGLAVGMEDYLAR